MKKLMSLMCLMVTGCTVSSDQIIVGLSVVQPVLDVLKKLGLLLTVAVIAGGCAMIKPTTEVKVDPMSKSVSLYNTKDVDLHVDNVQGKSGDSSFSIDNLTVSDKSSPVIKENVQQMLAFVEQQKAANEGIAISLAGVSNIIRELIPYLQLTPDTYAAMIAQLRQIDLQIDVVNGQLKTGKAASGSSEIPNTQPVDNTTTQPVK